MVTTMELVREALRDPQTFSRRRRGRPAQRAAAGDRGGGGRHSGGGRTLRSGVGLERPADAHPVPALGEPRVHPPRAGVDGATGAGDGRGVVGALPHDEVTDLIDAVARPLPIYAILRILGLPDDRREDIVRWSDAATASLGAKLTAQRWIAVEREMLDFQRTIGAELDERRVHPQEDLLSALAQGAQDASDGQVQLGTNELVWLVRELLVAGNETTTRTIAEIVLRLDDTAAVWGRIRNDPAQTAKVIEEGLRLSSPAIGMFRG